MGSRLQQLLRKKMTRSLSVACRAWSVFLLLVALPAGRAARILVQAEDLVGTWREQRNIHGYLGRGFRTSNANPQICPTPLSGTVDVLEAGPYTVWSRGYISPGARRGFRVRIDGHTLSITHENGRRGWCWQRCGQLNLDTGRAALSVLDAGRGYESVDAILMTNEKDDNPMADDLRWRAFPDPLPREANALAHTIEACCRLSKSRPMPLNLEDWNGRK